MLLTALLSPCISSEMKLLMDLWVLSWWDLASSPLTGFHLQDDSFTDIPHPKRRHLALTGTPSVDLRAHVGVAFVSYFYHRLFNQGQPHRSWLQFPRHKKKNFMDFTAIKVRLPRKCILQEGHWSGLGICFFSLESNQDWKLQPTDTLLLFLGFAPIISPSSFILTSGN